MALLIAGQLLFRGQLDRDEGRQAEQSISSYTFQTNSVKTQLDMWV